MTEIDIMSQPAQSAQRGTGQRICIESPDGQEPAQDSSSAVPVSVHDTHQKIMDMPRVDVSEEDVRRLVHAFYGRVRQDALLAPIFLSHVHDWEAHLVTLVDFWCWLVIKKEGYSGNPMPKHMRLEGLTWMHFERWLELFHQTSRETGLPQLQGVVDAMSARIAATLWNNYQKHNPQLQWMREMPEGLESYKRSPNFTPESLPAAFKSTHTLKHGTWGLLRVRSGAIVFTQDTTPSQTVLLRAGEQLVIPPRCHTT